MIAERIRSHKKIVRALRVDENIVLLQLDSTRYYFDLTKGESDIYIDIDYPLVKRFSAPFDRVLERKFTRSRIVEVRQWERFLVIGAELATNFKREINYLRFEFTGRHTNAIILDSNGVVVEALRHITADRSSRVVLPGVKLEEPPSRPINETQFPVEDLVKWSQERFKEKYNRRLEQAKKGAINRLNRRIKRVEEKLGKLEREEELMEKAEQFRKWGELLLANLHRIAPYQREIELEDWEGNKVIIPLPQLPNPNKVGEFYFKKAQKLKNKATNLKIEREHLLEQLRFLKNYKKLIEESDQFPVLKRYLPKKEERESNIHKVEFDGFQILIGKNEKGNRELLQKAKGEDIWLHIRDYPGPHVIIKNRKLGVPMEVIKEAARLAVRFAGKEEGVVDYTRRKFVKLKEGAKVEFGKYSSVKVKL